MTEHELDLFTQDLLIAFPAFNDAAKGSQDIELTYRSWQKAWTELSIGECRDALRRLVVDGGISYDDYRSPGPFIRRLVMALRKNGGKSEAELADRDRSRYEREHRRKTYVGSPMAQALAAARECNSIEEAYAAIEAIIPTRAEYDQPSYRCSTCTDRGLVLVWRADFASMVNSGKKQIEQLTRSHTYLVACYCSIGRQLNESKHERGRLPAYSADSFCLFKDHAIEDERAKLQEWIKIQSQGKAWVG